MSGEKERSAETIEYPSFGDVIRINPGYQRANVEDEEWVVISVDEQSFSAGLLFKTNDGKEALMGSGTFRYPELGEVIGHMEFDEMLARMIRWVEQMVGTSIDSEARDSYRSMLEESRANQFRPE